MTDLKRTSHREGGSAGHSPVGTTAVAGEPGGVGRFTEDELLPLSALQHLVFCERQCGLLLLDQLWRDNPLTLEGSRLHQRVHEAAPRREVRGNLLITRGLPLQSLTLGVVGVADVVEFHRVAAPTRGGKPSRTSAIQLPGATGWWRPFPVEYKRGKPKRDYCDEVQLCAQAICIEEMLQVEMMEGALFYGSKQHRHEVRFTAWLREQTRGAARRLHELFLGGSVPRLERQPKCRRCSLVDICRPDATAPQRSVARYLANIMRTARREEEGEEV